ncbi:ROK family protein [uncultured Thermanaerothrix sp.]|uniref:ROK family protein n=1 Tax=uncultured Thermanaerothrix sp. TaxID=1195149 RepID=UPI002616B47F|nr:ROK family protein [uncultured Thermanaerothrix sp.]
MSPSVLIGIDLGGTNVRVGAVSRQGEVLAWAEAPIEASRGPQAGLQRISGLIEQVLAETRGGALMGIGMGATGPIDRQRGSIQNPYTLPTWEDVPIVQPLRERFGVPVALENDADAAALGEAWVGAGRDRERVLMVTVGTGIGSAFIYRGEVYRGVGGAHPEAGHLVLDMNGPPCYCGARGCWESLAAGPAIARRAQALAQGAPTIMLDLAGGRLESIDARVVVMAAQAGDALAQRVVQETAAYLALGLVNLLIAFLPDVVILGGGVMRAYPVFAPYLHSMIKRHSVVVPLDAVQLEVARLGVQAGAVGAAYAALKLIKGG